MRGMAIRFSIGGFVVGAVNKNIEVNKQAELKKQQKV
jgi:hypothetical protein